MLDPTLLLVIFGILGGLARHIASQQGTILLPHLDHDAKGNLVLDMGFLWNVFAGLVMGLLVPYGLGALIKILLPEIPIPANNPAMALVSGYFGAHFFEKLAEYAAGKLPSNSTNAPFKNPNAPL